MESDSIPTGPSCGDSVVPPASNNHGSKKKKKNLLAVLMRATKRVEKQSTKDREQKLKNDLKEGRAKKKKQANDDREKAATERKDKKEFNIELKKKEKELREEAKTARRVLSESKKTARRTDPKFRQGKPTLEVDLDTPYYVRATPPVYEANVSCAVKVDPEDVSIYINTGLIKEIVTTLEGGDINGYLKFHKYIQCEYGPLFKTGMFGNYRAGLKDQVVKKLWHINQAFTWMMTMPCQDPRCTLTDRMVVDPDRVADEINGELKFFLRRGRGFTVNDPLAFNTVMREMLHFHTTFPRPRDGKPVRGTKSITDVLHLLGIGPPAEAHAWNTPRYRGYRNTDPDKTHPDGDRPGVVDGRQPDGKEATTERDGLYFRRYEYDVYRIHTSARQPRYFNSSNAANISAMR
ncbi:hypothetical protein T484DRAFT_1756084 [Baffinella frigidus]|nr:hypothetical protein T484DRAFT_1756084 [Cryptophyta sp. CCMP2293]